MPGDLQRVFVLIETSHQFRICDVIWLSYEVGKKSLIKLSRVILQVFLLQVFENGPDHDTGPAPVIELLRARVHLRQQSVVAFGFLLIQRDYFQVATSFYGARFLPLVIHEVSQGGEEKGAELARSEEHMLDEIGLEEMEKERLGQILRIVTVISLEPDESIERWPVHLTKTI